MNEKNRTFFSSAIRRFLRHKLAAAGLVILLAIMGITALAPVISPYDPRAQSFRERLEEPSWKHPLGTDQFGRDMLSRVIYGGRISLLVGFVSVFLGATVGGTIGLLAGYFRRLDNLLMRLMDIFLAFPAVLLAIAVMAILGPGLLNVMIAVGVRSVPSYARVLRSTVLTVKEMPYTEASRSMGASHLHTMLHAILPNSFAPVLVYSTLQLSGAILLAAVLSFLGLGVQPPTAEWGIMVSEGRGWLRSAPHIAIAPGIAILLIAMAFNLVGDGLRDSLDVRLKESR
jgi:ABC-type dipeptide/oligopeptide/nickel transport system permease subunit